MMIRELKREDFSQVITLGNQVHGNGYLTQESLTEIFNKGIKHNINAHFVAVEGDSILGFRLTYAPQQWQVDEWCSTEEWGVSSDRVCYFKSNTIAEAARGQGLGGRLLQRSIAATVKQGATAGVAHIWKQSPNQSAFRYFTKAGGQLIREYPDRWSAKYMGEQYHCVTCGGECHCTACEMILHFGSNHV